MKTFLALVMALLVAGCGSLPEAKFGSQLEKPDLKFKVKLEGKGQIFLAQKLSGKEKCDVIKKKFSVTMRDETNAKPLAVDLTCSYLKGQLVAISKKGIEASTYLVEVDRDGNNKWYVQNPVINAKYADPNFAAGSDYTVDGAKDLPAGQTVNGSVDYAQGNSTHWVRLKGKDASVGVTLVLGKEAKDIHAQVYDLPVGQQHPKLVGVLQNRARRSFKLKSDNLVIKVSAKNSGAKGEYALVRSDVTGSRAMAIPVLDCYQMGEGSVVLLNTIQGMKVNDMVTVFGKTAGGKNETIGHCQVSSIVESQASCKMDSVPQQNYVEYRAEVRI